MKSDKNHLNSSEKKDTKTGPSEKSYTFSLAIILGIVSVIISLSIGFFAYKHTLKITEERYHMFYMNKAKMLAGIADSHKDTAKDILLNEIETSWKASGDKPPDEYICIVDKDANLILHTAHPGTIGKYVGNNVTLDSQGKQSYRLHEIVQSQVDNVGNYISSSGQSQIAAFAAIPQRQWILGVHRSKDVLIKGIKTDLFYFGLGFIIVCGFFLPVSLVLLYVTFKASNRKRMNAEEEQKESKALLEKAQEIALIGHWTLIPETGVVTGSDELFRIFGLSSEEATLDSFMEVVHPDDREMDIAAIQHAAEHGESWDIEHRLICRDGKEKWVHAIGEAVTDEAGNVVELVGTVQDITDRKRMEEELIKLQKLESVGILAGGIAHDFNNYLQGILSNIALAKSCTDSNDKIYFNLNESEKAVIQAKNLTQQLLTFSKGGDPIKKAIFVCELIKDSANFALSGSNVRCELELPDCKCLVEVDKGQINQVFNNLFINADQAMPAGGVINVIAEHSNVEKNDLLPLQEGRYIKITIKDKGTGIPEEHLQKIFDPYFTTKETGSGLGLATVFSIIKKHDGHITVESEMEVGTTFYIYLPASQKEIPKKTVEDETDKKSIEKMTSLDGRKILFMEDDGIIRISVTRQLRGLKYEVEDAKDGNEMIKLYKKVMESDNPFDAVIMDLTIPGGMGGEEAIKELLKIDPDAKAIVTSGYSDNPIMTNFSEYGFKGVVEKPFEIYELNEVLQKVIMEKEEC